MGNLLMKRSDAEPGLYSGFTSRRGVGSLYKAADWALVRAPLLSIETYLALGGSCVGLDGEEVLARAGIFFEDNSLVPRDLDIRRALAVGSSDLLDALERCEPGGREAARLRGKLLRYLIRMSTRATPYGLFAGVALARWGSTTDLRLAQGAPRIRARPDMDWLLGFVLKLETQPEIRKELCFFANPLSFIHAGRVFLSERAPTGAMTEVTAAVSLRATKVVRRALALARAPVPYKHIVAELLSASGATLDKVEELITQLWEQTILLTDLRPPLTIKCPARYVARRLEGIPAAKDALAGLNRILDAMTVWDGESSEGGVAGYRQLGALTNEIHGSLRSKPTVQVDMAYRLDGCQINEAVAGEVARAAELLLRLTPLPRGLPHLDEYRRRFEARYGRDQQIKLVELLDPNFGLGPPSRRGHGSLSVVMEPHANRMRRQQTLYDLAVGALRERRSIIELDEDIVTRLGNWTPDPSTAPISLDIAVFVVATSATAIDSGQFQIVIGPNLGATAAGRTLGRFADLLAPDAKAALRNVACAEAAHAPGQLWAEVSYLPRRFRSANVVVRPLVRNHEINVGTTSVQPLSRTIPLDDLVVGVRDDRFFVWLPTANAEVVACAGHMLNTFDAPEVCRFLEDLRQDGVARLNPFDWGPVAELPYLPRVQMGRIVLAPAQWRINHHTRVGGLSSNTPGAFQETLKAWRDRWQVPKYVYMSVGDNRLLLDLDHAAQSEQLRAEVRRIPPTGNLVVHEALPGPGHAWAEGSRGHYVTEIVVPLVLRGAPTRNSDISPMQLIETQRRPLRSRLRPPGTDWLFVKLYCPWIFQDDLIIGPISAFCDYVDSSGMAQEWFFIRYSDPDPHLRLRFQGEPENLVGELIPQICAWATTLISDGLCSRFCFDTYDREVQRYGGPEGVAAAEAIFAADSRAVAELLTLSQGEKTEIDRTTLAALSIDDLLVGLALTDVERLEWYRQRVRSKRQSGPEYRQRQADLRLLLGNPAQLNQKSKGDAVTRVFTARRQALAQVRRHLDVLADEGKLKKTINILCNSYVHLHCNRLLGIAPPAEELMLGLLWRAHEGLNRAPVPTLPQP